jgi:hypothetical protein
MNADDLNALRNPLLVLVVVIAAGIGGIYYLDQNLAATKRELAQQTTQMRDARTKLQRSGDEKNIIVRYLPDYQKLEKLGFAGEEQRLNWVEGLRLANQEAQLFGITYQIGAQQPYPYASDLNPGQLLMHQSAMKISYSLLHEGDLMSLLRILGKQGAGFFSVNQCQIERSGAGATVNVRYQPNLRAECELTWITVSAPTTANADKKP